MLMVGNTGVNRILAYCCDFTAIRNMDDMVFQSPGGFEATQKGYFYQRAREQDKRLARRVIQGERFHPASNSLWFFEPDAACPDRKSTRLNSSHVAISYAVFCLKKK